MSRSVFLTLTSLILLAESAQATCCLPDGSCLDSITIQACVARGGVMKFASPSCAAAPCSGQPPQVACCLPSGVCSLTTAIDCAMSCGRVVPGGSCQGVGCEPAQACCMPNGVCEDRTVQCCLAAGGTPQGSGTACICSCGTTYDCSNPPDPQLTGGGKDDESAMPVPAGGPQQIVERGGGEVLPGEVYLDREYVYGPDYVDEFIAQFDRDGHAIFMMQDGNYNVVALVSGPGHPDGTGGSGGSGSGGGGTGVLPTGTVLEQYTYEPYGALVAAELYYPHAMNRAGHQGLFFERFDGSYDDYTLFRVAQGTAFITGAKGLYYNRNRFYSPTLCRFTTRDPNETALPIVAPAFITGDEALGGLGTFQTIEHYSNGLNTYSYLGHNPVKATDEFGLEFSLVGVLGANGIRMGTETAVIASGGIAALITWQLRKLVEQLENVRIDVTAVHDSDSMCRFYHSWCKWASTRPKNDRGKGWKRNAPCFECYKDCLSSRVWNFLKCPMGGPSGPRWPAPNDDWEPVWPTGGEYTGG